MGALLLLPLFLLPANRDRKAWRIWVSVVVTDVLGIAAVAVFANSDDSLREAVCAFVIGVAAVWLCMPYLGGRRVLALLKFLPVLAGFSVLAFGPTLLGSNSGWLDLRQAFAIGLGCTSLAVALALVGASCFMRRKFRRMRLVLLVIPLLLVSWVAILGTLQLGGALGSGSEWREVVFGTLVLWGLTAGLILPTLLFSFWEPFYRARLMRWMGTEEGVEVAERDHGQAVEAVAGGRG